MSYSRKVRQSHLTTVSYSTHGEAPADARWGLHGQRTTAGVQQAISYLCATSTLEEAANNFSRLLLLEMSARQALSLLQPLGEAL